MESPLTKLVDLKPIARGLKLISITQGLLWFLACYAGIGVSVLSWATAIGLCIAFIAAPSGGTLALSFLLITALDAAMCLLIALLAAKAAERWRNLRSLPILFMVIAGIFCFPGFLVSLLLYSPGLVGRSSLRKSYVGRGTEGYESVANILERDGSLESTTDDEKRDARQWAIIKIFTKYGGILLLISVANQFIGLIVVQAGDLAFSIVFTVITLPLGMMIAFFISSRITQRLHDSRRLLAPESATARAVDSRPPILLLRSFKDESKLSASGKVKFLSVTRSVVNSFEEHMTDRLWRFGPVVALGRPGEDSPPAGAAREYLRQEEWQGRFVDLAASCAAIVVIAGVTPGITWEVRHIIDNGLYGRLLIVIPSWMKQEEWSTFWEGIGGNWAGLPIDDAKNRLLGIHFAGNQLCGYYGPPDQFGFEALSIAATVQVIWNQSEPAKDANMGTKTVV